MMKNKDYNLTIKKMEFRGSFRSINDDAPASEFLRSSNICPMILIKANGTAVYANSPAEKDELVKEFNDQEDLLLWAWAGKYRTDIFRLDNNSLKLHYRKNEV